jgi:hypothetical protein
VSIFLYRHPPFLYNQPQKKIQNSTQKKKKPKERKTTKTRTHTTITGTTVCHTHSNTQQHKEVVVAHGQRKWIKITKKNAPNHTPKSSPASYFPHALSTLANPLAETRIEIVVLQQTHICRTRMRRSFFSLSSSKKRATQNAAAAPVNASASLSEPKNIDTRPPS